MSVSWGTIRRGISQQPCQGHCPQSLFMTQTATFLPRRISLPVRLPALCCPVPRLREVLGPYKPPLLLSVYALSAPTRYRPSLTWGSKRITSWSPQEVATMQGTSRTNERRGTPSRHRPLTLAIISLRPHLLPPLSLPPSRVRIQFRPWTTPGPLHGQAFARFPSALCVHRLGIWSSRISPIPQYPAILYRVTALLTLNKSALSISMLRVRRSTRLMLHTTEPYG